MMRSKAERSTTRSLRTGNAVGAPRLDGDGLAVLEAAHVQLAGGGARFGPCGDAVDHQRAGAADALAAVVVEGDRLLALRDQPLVEHVEHLEERHVGRDVVDGRSDEAPLAGSFWRQMCRLSSCITLVAPLLGGELRVLELEGRGSLCSGFSDAGPLYSQAATWQKFSSSRLASPSGSGTPRGSGRRRLLALERVAAHQLAELEEVGHAAGLLERWLRSRPRRDVDVLPELLAQLGDLLRAPSSGPLGVAGHAARVPHDLAELAVEGVDRALALDRQELVDAAARPRFPRRRANSGGRGLDRGRFTPAR
jgi:hypothetical protein